MADHETARTPEDITRLFVANGASA